MSAAVDIKKLIQLEENISRVIIGKQPVIRLILTALLAKGHVLLEDMPGTGKTMLAKSLAASIDGSFKRVQFTPDLLPSDVTGIQMYNQKKQEFEFIAGPVFTNILLADEINRATPRTQSCLLEAMGEGQVTTEGTTRRLNEPFFIIATENPIETAGTFPLPEAQLDRFAIKLSIGLPDADEELAIIDRYIQDEPLLSLAPVCTLAELSQLQKAVCEIQIHEDVRKYIVDIICATRNHKSTGFGVNPRGTLTLMRLCQAYALFNNRSYVIPEDVKTLAKPCLCHRIISTTGIEGQTAAGRLIDEILRTVPVPTENFT